MRRSDVLDAANLRALRADRDFNAALKRSGRHRAAAAGADQLHVRDGIRDADEPDVAAVAVNRRPDLVERGFDARFKRERGHESETAAEASFVATVARGPGAAA